MTMQAQPAVSIIPHSLQAVLDRQPGTGRPHSFHVTVEIEVEVHWTVELVEARPQGINHLIKLLRLEIVRPPGAGGPTARRMLRYTETPPCASYGEVWLGDGDRAVSARVAVVT